jgi:hypothetical protein
LKEKLQQNISDTKYLVVFFFFDIKVFYWLSLLLILGLKQKKKESSITGNIAIEEMYSKEAGQGMNCYTAIHLSVHYRRKIVEN